MIIKNGKPIFLSNNNGGILGGISSGQDIVCRIVVKPTSSITTERKKYIEGEAIKVSFANGPQNPKDWVGLYGVEMIPESVAAPAWAYVNGSKVPGEGVANGNIVFSDPLFSIRCLTPCGISIVSPFE